MYHTGSSNYNAYSGVRHINSVDSHHKYKILQQDQLTPKLQDLATKKYLINLNTIFSLISELSVPARRPAGVTVLSPWKA